MTTLVSKSHPRLSDTDTTPIEEAISDYSPPRAMSRRKLLAILSTAAAGIGAAGALGQAYRSGALDGLLNPEETINILSLGSDPNSDYAEFRGSTFKFYPIQARVQDNGVLGMVYRANARYGSVPIKGDLATRATDLFSMINTSNLDIAQKGTFKAKYQGTVGIQDGQTYNVPVYVK